MDNILFWNIKGYNEVARIENIINTLPEFEVGLLCILETKVKVHNFPKVIKPLSAN